MDNPFRSPETTELAPSDRFYELPKPGGWRPRPALSAFLLAFLIVLAAIVVAF